MSKVNTGEFKKKNPKNKTKTKPNQNKTKQTNKQKFPHLPFSNVSVDGEVNGS